MRTNPAPYWNDPCAADFRALAARSNEDATDVLHHDYERQEMRAARLLMGEVARGRVPREAPELAAHGGLHDAIETFEEKRGQRVVTLSAVLHPSPLHIGDPLPAASWWSPPALAVALFRHTVMQVEKEHGAMFAGRSVMVIEKLNRDLPETNQQVIRDAAEAAGVACAMLADAAMWTAPESGPLGDEHLGIIKALYSPDNADFYVRSQAELLEAYNRRNEWIARRTLQFRIRGLLKDGYIQKPFGMRTGLMLTDAGRAIAHLQLIKNNNKPQRNCAEFAPFVR